MACATLKRSLDWEPQLAGGGGRPAKRRRCIPFCGHRSSPPLSPGGGGGESPPRTSAAPQSPSASSSSAFSASKMTPEYMAENIKAELKRLQRRKQLQYGSTEPHGMEGDNSDPSSSRSADRALFTFKQVGMICERMLRERELEIREEYDTVLAAKLAEQYDAFVKFTYDQIQKNYSAAPPPSYLS